MNIVTFKNIQTFNNWGTLQVEYNGKIYDVIWKNKGEGEIETNAPKFIRDLVHDYMFNY